MIFAEDDMLLLAAIRHDEVMYWHVESGGILENSANWTTELDDLQSRWPTMATFCPQLNLLAIVYRGEDIVLWNYELDRLHDVYEKETGSMLHGHTKIYKGSTTVWNLAFGLTRDDVLLAAAYHDGDLVVYRLSDDAVQGIMHSANAHKLAFSPDGRTLACADSNGTIQLLDMGTNKMLYQIEFEGDVNPPVNLAFTSDNCRLIDIRAGKCRLWDPIVLLRQNLDDEGSDTVSIPAAPQEVVFQGSMSTHITTIEYIPSLSIVFCGKEDGSVIVYDTTREPNGHELFVQKTNVPIVLIHYSLVTGYLV